MKYIGAILVVLGCGATGVGMAAGYKRELAQLNSLIRAGEWMLWELEYRLPPLQELVRQAAGVTQGILSNLLEELARELERKAQPDARQCMKTVLEKFPGICPGNRVLLMELGTILGRFDLSGQIQGMKSFLERCKSQAGTMEDGKTTRLRSYQTLALCAGAALAILLL